jgi:hypothetical protein
MKKNVFLTTTLIIFCFSLIYSQPLSVSINSITDATCNGINNGSISSNASNGTGSYTYSWSPSGGTSSTATNLAPGTYTVTVTDAAMTTATATATVNEISPVIITTDAMSDYFGYNISCSGGNNGWINTTASGGLMVGIDSVEFNYTGSQQIFIVPAGITQVTLKAWGAQGGANWVNNTNFGGYAKGDLAVTPGETLYVYVGEQPTTGIAGGYNGGGSGDGAGKGGGGASDVRQGGITLNDRKIVGAGAGGAGYWSGLHVAGGIGGGLTGGNGYRDPDYASNPGGLGATQTAGGAYGTCISFNVIAMAGGFGYGGTPYGSSCGCEGYGGGAGWYGGAGSGNCRAGGGGSSYIALLANATTVGGVRSGNGKVTITYGAPESISYLWSDGTTTDDATNLAAGTNTLTATSMSGCVTTETYNLTQPTQVNANLNPTNISCNGANDGMITANPSGGIPGYTYLWPYNSSTSSSINGLFTGTYSVNITDTAGCSYTDSISITEPSAVDIDFTSSNSLCFGGNEGTATAIASGGTPGYTYLWSPNSETTATISNLTQGVYVLAVTDSNGCTYTDSISISQPVDISLSSTTIGETTGNNGSIDLTVSGGTPGYTYSWSNSATTQDISGLAGGSYTVIVTDANGCDDTLTVVVSSTFGIAEIESNELTVYPNPNEGIFYIQPDAKIKGEFSLSMMDLHGKVVYLSTGTINSDPIAIDATKLAAGTYIIKFQTEIGLFTKRIVIK